MPSLDFRLRQRAAVTVMILAMASSSCGIHRGTTNLVNDARAVCARSIHRPVEKLGVVNHVGKRWIPMPRSGNLVSVDLWDMHGYYRGRVFECLMYDEAGHLVFLSGSPG